MHEDLGIYRSKSILVTGHTGFKGTWLSIWLHELGANVIGYSLDAPTDPNMFEAVRLEDRVTHILGDVRDVKHLKSIFKEYEPEIIFHLAAQPIVRRSYKEPRLTFETNVMGTVNLLDTVKNTGCAKVVIVVTSDKCYENQERSFGYRETDRLGGHDPYSSSKGCAELAVSAYRSSFFSSDDDSQNVAIASVRAGNVIGGGDWGEDRLVPDCVRALSAGKDIVVRNPMSVRPWQHVLEPLSGYLLLGTKLYNDREKFSTAWNFGPAENDAVSVEEIVKRVIAYWGEGKYRIKPSDSEPKETKMLKLDCSKARELMGWKPTYSIDEALKQTIAWYKEYYKGRAASHLYVFTVTQILEYVAKGGYRSGSRAGPK